MDALRKKYPDIENDPQKDSFSTCIIGTSLFTATECASLVDVLFFRIDDDCLHIQYKGDLWIKLKCYEDVAYVEHMVFIYTVKQQIFGEYARFCERHKSLKVGVLKDNEQKSSIRKDLCKLLSYFDNMMILSKAKGFEKVEDEELNAIHTKCKVALELLDKS
jgi:hypothetical protein